MAVTSAQTDPIVSLSTVVIVGGGCYGTFYAGQLERARARGAATYRRLLVIDRDPRCQITTALPPDPARELVVDDWGAFFDRFLSDAVDSPDAPDAIVPSPLMPHLMYEWLLRGARARWPGRAVESRPLELALGTPYETLAPSGTRLVSFADWLCPVHCVEPAVCPVIRGPRTWEMSDAVGAVTAELGRARPVAGPVLFVCRHRVFGVGMVDVASVREGARVVAEAGDRGGPVDVVVGTVSHCHGAVSVLHLGNALG